MAIQHQVAARSLLFILVEWEGGLGGKDKTPLAEIWEVY